MPPKWKSKRLINSTKNVQPYYSKKYNLKPFILYIKEAKFPPAQGMQLTANERTVRQTTSQTAGRSTNCTYFTGKFYNIYLLMVLYYFILLEICPKELLRNTDQDLCPDLVIIAVLFILVRNSKQYRPLINRGRDCQFS